MPTRQGTVDHCLELLGPIGQVSAQRMFGGHRLRIDGHFVALIIADRLYLKADATTRAQFQAAGCEPFTYAGNGKPVTVSYWTVPPQAMDSPAEMRPWARLALDAALRAQASRRRAASAKPAAKAARTRKPGVRPAARKGARNRP